MQQNFKTLAKTFKQNTESFLMMIDIAKHLHQQRIKERKLNRDFETETDPELKDAKFDKMLAATRETIKKQGSS